MSCKLRIYLINLAEINTKILYLNRNWVFSFTSTDNLHTTVAVTSKWWEDIKLIKWFFSQIWLKLINSFCHRLSLDHVLQQRSHPSGVPRLSWGCRRSLCPHRLGKAHPPGGSHTGAAGPRRPGSRATRPPVTPAERQTGATEPPWWTRPGQTQII